MSRTSRSFMTEYMCLECFREGAQVLGWPVADHMVTALVTEAMAQACGEVGLRRSMGATGICWDISGAESVDVHAMSTTILTSSRLR